MRWLRRLSADLVKRVLHPLESLRATFFAAASPIDLAALRVLTYAYVVSGWSLKRATWDVHQSSFRPVGLYRLLGVASDSTLSVMYHAGHGAALLCCLGLVFRPAALVAALTLPYVMGVSNNFGKVNHSNNLFALLLVILAFSRAADFASVDWWWKQRRSAVAVRPSGEYRWPLAAVWLLVSGMYLSAGVSKLLHTGWSWAFSDNMQRLLLRHYAFRNPPSDFGYYIAQNPALCQGFAFIALLGELLSPLLLLGGTWTLLFGGLMAALQLGIYLMLGVPFKSMIPVFSAFVPWGLAGRWGRAWWLARSEIRSGK